MKAKLKVHAVITRQATIVFTRKWKIAALGLGLAAVTVCGLFLPLANKAYGVGAVAAAYAAGGAEFLIKGTSQEMEKLDKDTKLKHYAFILPRIFFAAGQHARTADEKRDIARFKEELKEVLKEMKTDLVDDMPSDRVIAFASMIDLATIRAPGVVAPFLKTTFKTNAFEVFEKSHPNVLAKYNAKADHHIRTLEKLLKSSTKLKEAVERDNPNPKVNCRCRITCVGKARVYESLNPQWQSPREDPFQRMIRIQNIQAGRGKRKFEIMSAVSEIDVQAVPWEMDLNECRSYQIPLGSAGRNIERRMVNACQSLSTFHQSADSQIVYTHLEPSRAGRDLMQCDRYYPLDPTVPIRQTALPEPLEAIVANEAAFDSVIPQRLLLRRSSLDSSGETHRPGESGDVLSGRRGRPESGAADEPFL